MTQNQHRGIRDRVVLKIDEHGRLQIPADLRKAAGIRDSGSVLIWLEQGHLHVVDTNVAACEAREICAHTCTTVRAWWTA
jgi:bifunctional DNA-binding transcriptional regulator/antitoxin component of YhaV-PrlF toxin-antitoxin module